MQRTLALFLLVTMSSGCGAARTAGEAPASEPSRPVAQFPEVARVAVVIDGEPPDLAALIPESTPVRVAEWTVESEPAAADPVYEPEGDPFEAQLDAIATERGFTLRRSASLRCVARELARFYARHEGMPIERLSRFLLAACGTSALDIGRAATLGRIPPSVPMERIASMAAQNVREAIGPSLDPALAHGLGVAREGERVAVVLVTGRPAGVLAPWTGPNELGEVHFEGRLDAPGDVLLAYVNQGELGVAPCRVEPMVQLPNIDVRCPVAEGDETALVNLATMTLGRVLARRAATLMIRRDGVRPVFRTSAPEEPEPGDPAAALLAHLNAARARAGLAPLTMAAEESAVHGRAAPFAVAAAIQRQEDVGEVVTLGLMAGWAIDAGTIRWAQHVTDVELATRAPAQWVESALAEPTGRLLLLRPDARQAAIGVVSLESPPAIAATVSTYSFFEDVDHAADAERLFARIERERAARGLPPPRRMEGLDLMREQAARVSQGAIEPAAAFQIALDGEARRRRQPLSGVRLEAVDLDHATLPSELFTRRELSLGLAVGHTRARGAAWGQYVVFFAFGR